MLKFFLSFLFIFSFWANGAEAKLLSDLGGLQKFRLFYSDLSFYEGYMIDGKRDGFGVFKDENGDRYRGEWKNDQREGEGVFICRNFDRFTGTWEKDLKEGYGVYRFHTGESYKGNWSKGKRHGKGRFKWADGSSYKGTWRNGLKEGTGIWKNGKGKTVIMKFKNGIDITGTSLKAVQEWEAKRLKDYKSNLLSVEEEAVYLYFAWYKRAVATLDSRLEGVLLPDLLISPKNRQFEKAKSLEKISGFREEKLKALKIRRKFVRQSKRSRTRRNESGKVVKAHGIESARLGVVLDISGSMTPHLDALKKKITKSFKGAVFLEVQGCSILETQGKVKYVEGKPFYNSLDAFLALVDEHDVDSIYWFSDLQDQQKPKGLKALHEMLLYNNVRLYVSSVASGPSKDLRVIITNSGGKFL